MTHGLVYNGDVGIGEVLVVPSLVHRPFTIISDHDATKIFCYAADLSRLRRRRPMPTSSRSTELSATRPASES